MRCMQLSDVMLPVAYSISQQVNQPGCCYYSSTSIEFRRLLAPHAPRQTYRRRRGEVKTVVHCTNQRISRCMLIVGCHKKRLFRTCNYTLLNRTPA